MKQLQCISIFLLLLFSTVSKAQSNARFSIIGKIITTDGLPLELANIALLSAEDSTFIQGTCSLPDGSFEFRSLTKERYTLQVSCLGYRTLCKTFTAGKVGNLTIESEVQMLTETVVTAHRPIYKLKGSTLITSIPNTLLSTVGTANDVLKHIPGIRLSEDAFSVFGKGTPIIYIDNHLIQSSSELSKLSSEEIEKIELISNPGPEYDATVKAVIRIRTIHRNNNGLSADAKANLRSGL